MSSNDTLQLLFQEFSQADSVLIIVSPQAKLDLIASAAAMHVALQSSGKKVQLLSPDVELLHEQLHATHVVGLKEAVAELGNRNLQIAFPYSPEVVDKVNYHIDEEQKKFFLTIEPQHGVRPLDMSLIEYSLVGAEADVIVLFGVQDLENLEQLYFGYERLYEQATTISINSFEAAVGDIKLDYSSKSCVSEGVLELLEVLGLPVQAEVATNLLLGIAHTTKNFSSFTTTAETFERVALLLRSGARRIRLKEEEKPVANSTTSAHVALPRQGQGQNQNQNQKVLNSEKELRTDNAHHLQGLMGKQQLTSAQVKNPGQGNNQKQSEKKQVEPKKQNRDKNMNPRQAGTSLM